MQTVKYIFAGLLVAAIFFAPCWLARKAEKGARDRCIVRILNCLFGWTGAGWLVALWWAVRLKDIK